MALENCIDSLSKWTIYLGSSSDQLRLAVFLNDMPQIIIDKIHITSKVFQSFSTTASLSQDAMRNRKCIMGI